MNLENLQFVPISFFPRTDDEEQPELYLKTADGNIYVGSWDSASGYFVAWEIVSGKHPEFNELPGRMYRQPIEFFLKFS